LLGEQTAAVPVYDTWVFDIGGAECCAYLKLSSKETAFHAGLRTTLLHLFAKQIDQRSDNTINASSVLDHKDQQRGASKPVSPSSVCNAAFEVLRRYEMRLLQ
jgi:hypothetical protein